MTIYIYIYICIRARVEQVVSEPVWNKLYQSLCGIGFNKKLRGTEFFTLMKHKCRPYLEYCHTLICIDRTFSKILYICKPHWWVHIYLYLSFHRQQGGHRYIFFKCTSFYPNPSNIGDFPSKQVAGTPPPCLAHCQHTFTRLLGCGRCVSLVW